jgi:hypothetical protein
MLDYESIKTTAKRIGRPIMDLIALSGESDPFYAGVGRRRQAAEWFAAIWADHGAAGTHLRRLHYKLVSTTALTKPDGSAYENTENDWQLLCKASLRHATSTLFRSTASLIGGTTSRCYSHPTWMLIPTGRSSFPAA